MTTPKRPDRWTVRVYEQAKPGDTFDVFVYDAERNRHIVFTDKAYAEEVAAALNAPLHPAPSPANVEESEWEQCRNCRGSGREPDSRDLCEDCHGACRHPRGAYDRPAPPTDVSGLVERAKGHVEDKEHWVPLGIGMSMTKCSSCHEVWPCPTADLASALSTVAQKRDEAIRAIATEHARYEREFALHEKTEADRAALRAENERLRSAMRLHADFDEGMDPCAGNPCSLRSALTASEGSKPREQ